MPKLQRSLHKWIFPSNIIQFDTASAFEAKDEIYWKKSIVNIAVGDIVYLYFGKPAQCIRYETIVVKLDIPFENTEEDKPFWDPYYRNEYRHLSFMKLRLIHEFYPDALIFEDMIKYDPAMPPQGPHHITKQLESFINGVKSCYEPLNRHRETDHVKLHFNTLIERALTRNIKTDVWRGKAVQKEYTYSNGQDKPKPKREPLRAANALKRADFLCEYDKSHKLFLRSNGKQNYTEPHHLIPINKHNEFQYSLDVEENIISLCSHCHNLLHYGRLEDKQPLLEALFSERSDALRQVGLFISFSDLISYYV